LAVCMFGSLYVWQFVCLAVCMFGSLYVWQFVCLGVCMFGSLYVWQFLDFIFKPIKAGKNIWIEASN